MHQLLAEPVSCEDGNCFAPTDKPMQSFYGLNSVHNAACSLPSDFGLSMGFGDFGRCTNNVPHGESGKRSQKAEHKEYEEKLAHDLIMASRKFFEKSSCYLYDLSSTVASTSALSNTFEQCRSSYDDAMFNDACKPECNAIPVVVEDMNADLKTDAACDSHEFRLFVTDDGSTSSSEECIPLVVEAAESRANSFDPNMVSDVVPTVVENLIDDCCQWGTPAVSAAYLPANILGFGDETNAMPHATSNPLSVKSHTDRLILGNVGDQRDENLPSCVVGMDTGDSLANGYPSDGGTFGSDRNWMAHAQCVDGGDLPTVLNFVEGLPLHTPPKLGADFSCAFQSIPSYATQAPLMGISWMVHDLPAADPLVAQSGDCSPFYQTGHHQTAAQAMQLQWSGTRTRKSPERKSRKWPDKLAAGSPKRRKPAGRREPEATRFSCETTRPVGAAAAVLTASGLPLSPWHASNRISTSYRAADITNAAGRQDRSVATVGDFPCTSLCGYIV